MKKHYIFTTIFLLLFCLSKTQAQFQIGIHGTYGIPTPKPDGVENYTGGGVLVRYFLTPKVAVGASVYAISNNQSIASLGLSYKATQVPVTAMIEYFPTEEGVRPYFGINAGAYNATIKTTSSSLGSVSASQSHFGIAPKVGLQIPITTGFRLFGEGAYNIVFNENATQTNQQEKTGKYIGINFGILLSFGNK